MDIEWQSDYNSNTYVEDECEVTLCNLNDVPYELNDLPLKYGEQSQ